MTLTVALVREVFAGDDGPDRLAARLRDARAGGAALVLLPELPLNGWSPATATPCDEDAEPPEGPRHRALAAAARDAGIAVVGGAIVTDPETGRRHNTALVFDGTGALTASYRKVHLPDEHGFRETAHYEPGDALSPIVEGHGLRLALQICSDINRPEGSHLLGALGAEVILNPRATEAATYDRWRTVLVATAITSGAFVLSVNRPGPEHDVALGGPSLAVSPLGDVLVETEQALATVTLHRTAIAAARRRYPGYLATRADLYAEGWSRVPTTRRPHERAAPEPEGT